MSEIKVITEAEKEFEVLFNDNASGNINGTPFEWDVVQVNDNTYHVIKNNKSFNIEILENNPDEKKYTIKINGKKYAFSLKDKYDELLHSLGMDTMLSNKVADLKAPMPGLVLDVSVGEGQSVSKGDALLILEAMKMENVIKSPTDGVIKSISVNKGDTVEKNQLILNFE